MRKVDGYGDDVAVAAASAVPPAEGGNDMKAHFGSVAFENHAPGYSTWTRAEGGRVAACPWGLPHRYRRNRHLIPGDPPAAHRYT